jgi:Ca2+-binding EF-hand superfamily protein
LEFEEFISKLGIFLARQELTTVYNSFDLNKDGNIQYEEFISLLRVSNNNNS